MFQLLRFARDGQERYKSLVFHPQVMGMNLGRVFTKQEADNFFLIITVNQACEMQQSIQGFYQVFLTDSNRFIGMLAITDIDEFGGLELEYMLLPAYWNQGYATALV